jgi:hypothetical protein
VTELQTWRKEDLEYLILLVDVPSSGVLEIELEYLPESKISVIEHLISYAEMEKALSERLWVSLKC